MFCSRAPIGYVAIAKNPVCTNQGFKSIIPNESINSGNVVYDVVDSYKSFLEKVMK